MSRISTARSRGLSGLTLVQALAGILLLAVVAPPGLATLVHRSRIVRAADEVRRLAGALAATLRVDAAVAAGPTELLVGPGRVPDAPDGSLWSEGAAVGLERYVSGGVAPDPWGNRYLVNIGAARVGEASAVWILSAGPNGRIETPFRMPGLSAVAGGDDIAARIE